MHCVLQKSRRQTGCPPSEASWNSTPWVTSVKHLGNILECSNSMHQDCSIKRAKFIGKLNSLQQEFHFAEPDVQMKILNIYSTSFYGSGLWDVFKESCEKF